MTRGDKDSYNALIGAARRYYILLVDTLSPNDQGLLEEQTNCNTDDLEYFALKAYEQPDETTGKPVRHPDVDYVIRYMEHYHSFGNCYDRHCFWCKYNR